MLATVIRPEREGDAELIRDIHTRAFGGTEEAEIVDRLRGGDAVLSLVAEVGGRLVGHILFSPVTLGDSEPAARGMGLGPVAVLPAQQRSGVGSGLVRRGLEVLRSEGSPFVVVLGHPTYYPRFGFEVASSHGLRSEFSGVTDEAFMVLELLPGGLRGKSGVVRYRPEFGG